MTVIEKEMLYPTIFGYITMNNPPPNLVLEAMMIFSDDIKAYFTVMGKYKVISLDNARNLYSDKLAVDYETHWNNESDNRFGLSNNG